MLTRPDTRHEKGNCYSFLAHRLSKWHVLANHFDCPRSTGKIRRNRGKLIVNCPSSAQLTSANYVLIRNQPNRRRTANRPSPITAFSLPTPFSSFPSGQQGRNSIQFFASLLFVAKQPTTRRERSLKYRVRVYIYSSSINHKSNSDKINIYYC